MHTNPGSWSRMTSRVWLWMWTRQRIMLRWNSGRGRGWWSQSFIFFIMPLAYSWLKISISYGIGMYFSSARTKYIIWWAGIFHLQKQNTKYRIWWAGIFHLQKQQPGSGERCLSQGSLQVQVFKYFFKCRYSSISWTTTKNYDNNNSIWRSPCVQKGRDLCSAREHDMARVLHQDDHRQTTWAIFDEQIWNI